MADGTDSPKHGPLSTTEAELVAAVDALHRAIKNAGPAPAYHREVMARHRAEWPTLWAAIDRLLRATT